MKTRVTFELKMKCWYKTFMKLKGRWMEKLESPFPQSRRKDYKIQKNGKRRESLKNVDKAGIIAVKCNRE